MVVNLKAARDRKRATSPFRKCEGRESWGEINTGWFGRLTVTVARYPACPHFLSHGRIAPPVPSIYLRPAYSYFAMLVSLLIAINTFSAPFNDLAQLTVR
jgi:hypothetical protein